MTYGKSKFLLLHMLRLFQTETDENEGLSMEQLKTALSQKGLTPDRKSIYACIDALEAFGLEISRPIGKQKDYRLLKAPDELELSEIKLLCDAVQASRFLSQAKANQLTRKLERLVSRRQASSLRRQVIISDRVKSMNNRVCYNVDALHTAIASDSQISFRYFDYSMSKKRVYRHGGKRYQVSPFAMLYNNDKYYLLAVPCDEEQMRTYRVDKLEGVEILDLPREGQDIFATVDLAAYTQVTFSMYAGETVPVAMQFSNDLLSVAMDRFGHQIAVSRHGEKHFRFTTKVAVSPRFYGWLFSFGRDAQIIAPGWVREGMQQLLQETVQSYASGSLTDTET